ncbi:MAG: nucleotidyltransferase domain-containing protein, partial [Planctomycetota bacterium]
MKKSLSYLPKHKRDELRLIVQRIREAVEQTEMIILFGSYARDEWVEEVYTERHVTYEYKSDFDILVVVEDHKIANRVRLWNKAEKKARGYPVETW